MRCLRLCLSGPGLLLCLGLLGKVILEGWPLSEEGSLILTLHSLPSLSDKLCVQIACRREGEMERSLTVCPLT